MAVQAKPTGWFRSSFAGVWVVAATIVMGAGIALADSPRSPFNLYPKKDGTLLDGIGGDLCDQIADSADWSFNGSSYEGTITLVTDPEESCLEHRLVWEYDLGSGVIIPPVSAKLTFVIRSPGAWPRPYVDVHVYSYPADLMETLGDFSAEPAVLQGIASVPPYLPPAPPPITLFTVSVPRCSDCRRSMAKLATAAEKRNLDELWRKPCPSSVTTRASSLLVRPSGFL